MTVHRLVADLRRRGFVLGARTADRASRGRRPSAFAFNAGIGSVVGIDVGNETIRAAAADLAGRILVREERPTDAVAEDLVGGLAQVVFALQRAARSAGPLVAVAVGVPGVTETEGGRIVRASLHIPWEGMPLGAMLGRAIGINVDVAQDDHLAALAELKQGACIGLRDALVLNVGKGIGAGLIADGQPYYGANGAAGRLGWIPIPTADGEGLQPASRVLTADGLIADYQTGGGSPIGPGALAVFEADAAGDPAARIAIDRFADRLGWLVIAAVSLIDPQRVVLGGGISGSFARLIPIMVARVSRAVPLPPSIVPSALGAGAGVIGAVMAAMDRADEWLLQRIAA
jgi:predicted NBD/HSP70 family sugar kinase